MRALEAVMSHAKCPQCCGSQVEQGRPIQSGLTAILASVLGVAALLLNSGDFVRNFGMLLLVVGVFSLSTGIINAAVWLSLRGQVTYGCQACGHRWVAMA